MDSGGPFEQNRPRPDGFELRTHGANGPRAKLETPAQRVLADAADSDMPTAARIEMLATSLDRIERSQMAALGALAGPAARKADQLKAAIAETGLSLDRIAPPKAAGVGGPYIPLKIDANASPFEKQLANVQGAFATLDRLHRALPFLPVRKPLAGQLDLTSGFGYRLDPFLGRPALHSGLDMRAESGTPARATAGGVVVAAAPTGGSAELVAKLSADHDIVIAVDGGGAVCIEAGVTPDIVLGDFDSLDPAALEWLRRVGVTVKAFPADKDQTDLELALAVARGQGAARVTVPAVSSRRLAA